ncbi:MAG: hypothetical protein ACYDB4_01480 [Candidatus Dormibacteraceae bacterium]
MISWRVPAESRRPYVPVRAPLVDVALGVAEGAGEGEALAAGD